MVQSLQERWGSAGQSISVSRGVCVSERERFLEARKKALVLSKKAFNDFSPLQQMRHGSWNGMMERRRTKRYAGYYDAESVVAFRRQRVTCLGPTCEVTASVVNRGLRAQVACL